jgi:hypothetical protein
MLRSSLPGATPSTGKQALSDLVLTVLCQNGGIVPALNRGQNPRKPMHKLISELTRLYLCAGTVAPEVLALRLQGRASPAISLATADGRTRALLIPFNKSADDNEAQHWHLLCSVANALQAELGLPAPAVSISGGNGYGLWLSLAAPVPLAQAQAFLELLRLAYFPDMKPAAIRAGAPLELPPCLHEGSGKWAAFIHPGLGASFADESGLEMAPPFTGQLAFLENLQSISEPQFLHALSLLQQMHGGVPEAPSPSPARTASEDGLLLKDATLEDIVRFLHSKNIEPSFRHRLPE